MWYISYFYGMILPTCAESAVEHQLTHLCPGFCGQFDWGQGCSRERKPIGVITISKITSLLEWRNENDAQILINAACGKDHRRKKSIKTDTVLSQRICLLYVCILCICFMYFMYFFSLFIWAKLPEINCVMWCDITMSLQTSEEIVILFVSSRRTSCNQC